MTFKLKLGSWRDWASMARLPNIPTVWSNVFTGWVLAGGHFTTEADRVYFCLALLASTMLYIGGTILNDWHDASFDQVHRPERPIPSGRVSRNQARLVATLLLGLGAVISIWGGNVLFLLLPLILFYTFIHKRFPLIGGIFMGLCRMALGLLAYVVIIKGPRLEVNILEVMQRLWALVLFFYICFISWIAMGEKVKWRRNTVVWMLTALPLLDAVFLIIAGEARMVFVPLGCFGLAWYLRRVASPT